MSDRYPLAPLMEALRITTLEPGWDWHRDSDVFQGLAAVATACGITHRTACRWATDGIPARHIDTLAIHVAGRMPWELWPEWTDDDPTEDDLAARICACRALSTPLPTGVCDRCGGTLAVAVTTAA